MAGHRCGAQNDGIPAPAHRMPPSPAVTWRPLAVLALLAVLAQLLLVSNPGYFSHDELQWGAAADVARWRDLPPVGWTLVETFQWRPLTFALWLRFSHALFETPVLFHAVWVLMGTGLAVALAALLQRLGAAPRLAAGVGLVFALNPYAAYVHGWVGTLADLLWVGAGLALAHVLLTLRQRQAGYVSFAVVAFSLTAVGLLAKEAALSLPALLGLAWLLSGRERPLFWSTLGSGLAAVVYLALRLPTLLAPGEADTYAVTLDAVPRNLAGYPMFLPLAQVAEIGPMWLQSAKHLAISAVLITSAWLLIARGSPRLAIAIVLGGALAVAPALPLPVPSNQYGYGFAAWLFGCVAMAWPRLGRAGRGLLWLLTVLIVWHGVNVQRHLRHVGERQAVFQPALVEALAGRDELVLQLPPKDDWIYHRLTQDIPAWRGTPIGDRVRLAKPGEAADALILEDGRLQMLR